MQRDAKQSNHAAATVVLQLAGKLDLERHAEFKAVCAEMAESEARRVILQLNRVELLSSSVLGLFVRLGRDLQQRGGRLVLADLSRACANTLYILRMDHAFPIYPNVTEAQRALENGGA